jgi:hypothetical protein
MAQITAIPDTRDDRATVDRWSLLGGRIAGGEVAITQEELAGERIAEDTGMCLVLFLQSQQLRPASKVIR